MSILTLPPEILWAVLQRVHLLDLHHIAVTCPRLLWTLLNTSCVRDVELVLNACDVRMPPLLRKFPQIRSLSVLGGAPPADLDYHYLLKIPRSVSSLVLACHGAMKLLLPEYTCVRSIDAAVAFFAHFSSLSQLVLHLGEDQLNMTSILARVLPATLVPLEISRITRGTPDTLPFPTHLACEHQLHTLSLPTITCFDSDASLAHFEHLEHIDIERVQNIPLLPSSSTNLHLYHMPDWLHERNAQVIELNLETMPSSNASFPLNLKVLTVSNGHVVEDRWIDNLPRSLERLSVFGNVRATNGSYPPALKKLFAYSFDLSSEEKLRKFPAGLTEMGVATSPDVSSSLFSNLPKSLIKFRPRIVIENDADFQLLLPNLTTLELFISGSSKVLNLPLRLVRLAVVGDSITGSSSIEYWVGILPVTLKSLTLKSKKVFFGKLPISALPRGLIKLDLAVKCFTALDTQICDFTALPSILESLTIETNFSDKFDASALRKLPDGLKVLHLRELKTVNDEDMRYLPRRLESLRLAGDLLTDACLPHLPPLLEKLSLRSNCNITPALFKHLPRYLVLVEMRANRNFPKALQDSVPRGLEIATRELKNM